MSVTMIPSRYLTFQGTLEDKMTSYLNLQNSSGKHLAFKILTNAPKGYFGASPKTGVVGPNEDASIRLSLAPLAKNQKRKSYKVQIQTLEVKSADVDLERIWRSVSWRKISMNELVACFVDNGDAAQKNLLDANAVVFNFSPQPSTHTVFGGTHYKPKSTSEQKSDSHQHPTANDQQPEEQAPANENWDQNQEQQQNQDQQGWDQNQDQQGWDQNQNQEGWDQNQDQQGWDQNQDQQGWDQNQQQQGWDQNQQQQGWDQNYQQNADLRGSQVKELVEGVMATSYTVWRESIIFAVAFFVIGVILGKAGF